jgi:hypothetical protein
MLRRRSSKFIFQPFIEPVLNTANVNVKQFGKLFTRTLDGYSYAHPLYVPNVPIPGRDSMGNLAKFEGLLSARTARFHQLR